MLILPEKAPDPCSPGLHPSVVVGIMFFEVLHEPLNQLAPGGEDGQTDHNEKDPLKDGEKEAQYPQTDEDPPDHQYSNFLEFIHGRISVLNILLRGQNQH
jgi:hypothetical protein